MIKTAEKQQEAKEYLDEIWDKSDCTGAPNSKLFPSVQNFHNIYFISSKGKNKVCPRIIINVDGSIPRY